MNSSEYPKLLDTVATAAHIGLAASTLENWRSSGTSSLRFIKCGRRVLYDPRDIEIWLDGRRVTSTSEPVRS